MSERIGGHTEGAWRHIAGGAVGVGESGHESGTAMAFGDTPEETEANARLIAAAPHLLDMLAEAGMEFFEDRYDGGQIPSWLGEFMDFLGGHICPNGDVKTRHEAVEAVLQPRASK